MSRILNTAKYLPSHLMNSWICYNTDSRPIVKKRRLFLNFVKVYIVYCRKRRYNVRRIHRNYIKNPLADVVSPVQTENFPYKNIVFMRIWGKIKGKRGFFKQIKNEMIDSNEKKYRNYFSSIVIINCRFVRLRTVGKQYGTRSSRNAAAWCGWMGRWWRRWQLSKIMQNKNMAPDDVY